MLRLAEGVKGYTVNDLIWKGVDILKGEVMSSTLFKYQGLELIRILIHITSYLIFSWTNIYIMVFKKILGGDNPLF